MTVFHRLNVAAIERETPDAVAITLRVPEELQNQYRYTPGQHLTLKALVNGEELRRCYSICSSPQEGLLQIGVKAIDRGRFSGFVNRMLKVGDALEVMVPQGRSATSRRQSATATTGDRRRLRHHADAVDHQGDAAARTGQQLHPDLRQPQQPFDDVQRGAVGSENRYPQRFQQLYLFSQKVSTARCSAAASTVNA